MDVTDTGAQPGTLDIGRHSYLEKHTTNITTFSNWSSHPRSHRVPSCTEMGISRRGNSIENGKGGSKLKRTDFRQQRKRLKTCISRVELELKRQPLLLGQIPIPKGVCSAFMIID
ncbi:hypothetical protein ACLOJK_032308 [Asimina triloba]